MEIPFPREALAAAGAKMAQAKGKRLELSEFDEILRHGLARADPDEVADALRETIAAGGQDREYRRSAYLALGKKSDPGLLLFFRDRLASELAAGDSEACYELMIALEALDEEVFSPRSGIRGAHEHTLNRRDAETYVAGLG